MKAAARPWPRRVCGAVMMPLVLIALGACSMTQVVRNKEVTAPAKDYRDVYLVKAKDDPRNVFPRAVQEFESMGLRVHVVDEGKAVEGAEGTAFLISGAGYLLTCAHVLEDEKTATVWLAGDRYEADVVNADGQKDIALLKLRGKAPANVTPLSFSRNSNFALGVDVYTIGYPASTLLGNGARLSKGMVSAQSGVNGNADFLQISADVQPGNSGGPLLAADGTVMGIVQQTANPWAFAQQNNGALPQHLNFALRGNLVADEIRALNPAVFQSLSFDRPLSIDQAEPAVAKVKAGIMSTELQNSPRLVATIRYSSMWDLWYRFRYFVVVVADLQTRQTLFAAGQGRDNLMSTEDSVLHDTFNEVRTALGKN